MVFTNLDLMDDRLLVRVVPPRHLTLKSGLILPESQRTPLVTGLVEAIGPGGVALDGSRITPIVKVGDYVQFSKNVESAVMYLDKAHPDREFRMMREGQVVWILRDFVEGDTEGPAIISQSS